MSVKPLGRFCWYDLMTTDVDAAQAFYRNVAGWGIEVFDTEKGPYPMWTTGGTPIGGVAKLPPEAAKAGAPPHWIASVSTPDIDATLAKASALGGATMMGPMEIPTVGRYAVIRDPQGAVLAVFQPAEHTPGTDEPARVGNFSWHELATEGWEDAWAFYSELFGWNAVDTADMGELGMYHMFGNGAHPIGGMFNRPPTVPVNTWMYYVRVDDLDAALERVKAGGGQVLNGPMVVPGGDRVAQCMDPQGAMVALHWSGMS